MSETHQRWPLEWPGNWPRTQARQRQRASFRRTQTDYVTQIVNGSSQQVSRKRDVQLSVIAAVERLEAECTRLGAVGALLSTDVELRLDGRPRSNQDPADPGAAVYFKLNGASRCLACDKWDRVADNIAALAAHIDALRRIDRYGVGTLDQAFRGYTALQPAVVEWWLVLSVPRTATWAQIDAAFTALAKQHHPDKGGDHETMAKLTQARELARQELQERSTGRASA